ncbi:hypothetical protein H6F98_01405 [Microcoleus sp. FACHB-SPT15]|uniref:DUF6658 family protein n=1 Tax=Microcoleus sp. FACHB-SPT15 TaxID=2692830 RepID=UPI00177AFFA1|nr:DUF6658 family protein [Microcoleus sp. FACHB-SPT15]MBD1804133.1 hypothetical protein [Microcoleus sp. FACHB-SPT15]
MNKVINWLKDIRLDRILTICLVGLLVVVTTACSGGASAKTADKIREEVPGSALTNEYKGGINSYSDVDPRQSTTGAEAKAKALVDNAQRNIDEKGIDSTEQYVENYRSGTPLGERTRRIGEDVGEAAKNVGEDVSKGAQKNAQQTKATAQDAAINTKQAADKTSRTAQSKVNESVKGAQRSVDNAADAGDSLGDKIKQAAENAADAINPNVNSK